jgi:hypothetical protein
MKVRVEIIETLGRESYLYFDVAARSASTGPDPPIRLRGRPAIGSPRRQPSWRE